MRYKLTALTPLLVGDGQKLSPIDYMVWKDQVNILDQDRIFRLLSKGPRLDGYLMQIKKAEKLDFASWGGFAQNFADRRVPFEHPSLTPQWEQTRAEHLFIPTFARGTQGPYVPGSALKGALRTGMALTRWNAGTMKEVAGRMTGERPPRRPGDAAESIAGGSGDTMRLLSIGDSEAIGNSVFRIYLVRVASLASKSPGKYDVSWKPIPAFAEMAPEGTSFSGECRENEFLKDPEIARSIRLRGDASVRQILSAANDYAAKAIESHRQYAAMGGLKRLDESLGRIEERLTQARSSGSACVVNLGWGGGLFGKSAWLDTENEDYRKILRALPYYERAVRTGLPFPKTRRIVWLNNEPATLPGWALLEMS